MNSDNEDDIIDPVMQCTTLPSHSGFSQKKLVSFVTDNTYFLIDFPVNSEVQDMTVNMEARNPSETKLRGRLLASKYRVKQGRSFQGSRPGG
ncbi:hypothetical protein Tco_0603395 [Tanacetum coccineum]